jgi:FkbM family methyltransferase
MNILSTLTRPEYLFQPSQIVRRILCELRPPRDEYEMVRLPWGAPIRIYPGESQGSCIRRTGVHDLVTNEVIWRLLDPGENAVDVGANIGHMTSVMAFRAGPQGKVVAVEPHPALFQELNFNVTMWGQMMSSAPIVARRLALSNREGNARLGVPKGFSKNRGLCFLVSEGAAAESSASFYDVEATTLDRLLEPGQPDIGLLKMDCEGHELQVLEGAGNLFASGRIRDVVFEEHKPPPTPVTNLLEANGYSVFHLDGKLLGPVTAPIDKPYVRKIKDAPNYLATLKPSRSKARLAGRGWGVYSVGPFLIGSSRDKSR